MTPMTLEEYAFSFVAALYEAARKEKPTASPLEVEGLAHRVLNNALYTYDKQLSEGSEAKSGAGVSRGSKQVQGSGAKGRTGASSKGIRKDVTGTTQRSSAKKRRGKKQ